MTAPDPHVAIADVKLEVTTLRGEMNTGMARHEGRLDVVLQSVDGMRAELQQRMTFTDKLLQQHNEDIASMKESRILDRDLSSAQATSVRQAVEALIEQRHATLVAALDALETRVSTAETWRTSLTSQGRVVGTAARGAWVIAAAVILALILTALNLR